MSLNGLQAARLLKPWAGLLGSGELYPEERVDRTGGKGLMAVREKLRLRILALTAIPRCPVLTSDEK